MVAKLRTLLLLITIINGDTVIADIAVSADAFDGRSGHNEERLSNALNRKTVLQEYLYEIQDSSTIEFRVDSPIGDVWARFQDFKGSFSMFGNGIQSDPVIVDINAESLDTEAGMVTMMLKSESFFNVEKFPSIRFVGTSVEWFNRENAVLKGYMTIQNVTRPVAFYIKLVNADMADNSSDRINLKATTTIKRSEFGINTLLPVVSDKVNLFLSIDALKKNTSVSMVTVN